MNRIEPKLASGFKDYLVEEMIPRQEMFDKIRAVAEKFGFSPIDTPGLEKEEIITGGDPDFKMNIWHASITDESEKMALRFDLTVPLARVVAANQNLKKPFRRYQIGKVWRGERSQAGRYREFVQFDMDIVGTNEVLADAEIIALMHETMTALGLNNFLIRINNRKILDALSDWAGFDSGKTSSVLRVVDKKDKQGWDEVSEELKNKIGLDDNQVQRIKEFLEISSLAEAKEKMKSSEMASAGLAELEKIFDFLDSLGVDKSKYRLDLSVARGLGYYTGPVFETILTDLPEIGSVFSGGRYDGLVGKFSSKSVPATGASVGVDRLFAAMTKLELIRQVKTVSKVLVLNFDQTLKQRCLAIASKIRKAGIPTEIFIDDVVKMKDQLGYASEKEIPLVIIIGPEEDKKGIVQLKDMRNGKQEEILADDLIDRIKQLV